MQTIEELINGVLHHEGGFVDDPDDPGGATNMGITKKTLEAYRGRTVSVAEVEAMTEEEAREIYTERYFISPKIDLLPVPIQPVVFDMYVNAGSNAVKILQRTLRELGENIGVDGGIGRKTAGAASIVIGRIGADELVDAYGSARREYYYKIADNRPKSRKYAKRNDGGKGGWITRAEAFMSEGARFSDREHEARISEWT
ncbi:MAG: holin-associated N-acetylmuramidase [Pikeienuella sp.]